MYEEAHDLCGAILLAAKEQRFASKPPERLTSTRVSLLVAPLW